ncbi:MAG: FeoB-associated Cys-rich membrane protein [Mucilaginibacter sp.]|jgi:hypothetical protein
MNVQLIIVLILFAGAVFYFGRTIYKSLTAKKGCGENCKCGVDFSNVESPKANKA